MFSRRAGSRARGLRGCGLKGSLEGPGGGLWREPGEKSEGRTGLGDGGPTCRPRARWFAVSEALARIKLRWILYNRCNYVFMFAVVLITFPWFTVLLFLSFFFFSDSVD